MESFKTKKTLKLTSILTMLLFLFTNVHVFALGIDSKAGEAYLKYSSYSHGTQNLGIDRYTAANGDVSYCLERGNAAPQGEDFTNTFANNDGIEAILFWGYPARDGSQFGLSKDEFRYCTQLAIWAYETEAGIGKDPFHLSRLANGSESVSRLKPAIDFLVQKGLDKSKPNILTLSTQNVTAKLQGNYLISDPVKIESEYNTVFQVMPISTTSKGLATSSIKIVDANGNPKNQFNPNETFRVEIPATANTGDVAIGIRTNYSIPVTVSYKAPSSGTQDMAVVPMRTDKYDFNKLKVNWTATKGKLELTKKDNRGNLVNGAVFSLKDSNGKVVATETTANGKILFNDLQVGTYQLVEDSAPAGFVKAQPQNVTIQPSQTTNVTVVDKVAQGKVAVQKTDIESGANLEGAIFTVYNAGGKSVATLTTNANGYAESGLLDYGKYTVKETTPPTGYLLNDKVYNVDIANDQQVVKVDAKDQIIKGKVQVLKLDTETKQPLEGATFQILQNGKQVATMVTGKDGTATSGLLPFGKYVVKEMKAPEKYTLNNQEFPVTIANNMETVKVTCENRIIKGKVSVKKTDAEVKGLNLEGAQFTIYDSNSKPVTTITTNKDGYAESGLINYGDYTMKETKAPTGYLLNDKVYNVQIREDGKTYNYDITDNVIKGKIQIVKVDADNEEKPVANAEFDVVAKDVFGVKAGTIVDHVTTDTDGFAYTKELRYGEYTFKEVKTPEGYWKSDKEYTMNITENGKTYVRYVKNTPVKALLRVVKTDGFNNKPLPGVQFQIRNLDTKEIVSFKKFVGILPLPEKTFTTDEKGEFMTPQPLAYGHYQLEEVKAVDGYVTMQPVKFTIDESASLTDVKDLGTVLTLNVKNERITAPMEMLKLDTDTKAPLKGVTFKVTALDGFMKGQTWNLTSDQNGKIALKDLQYGHYQIEEVKTLWNYVLNKEPIPFEVKENGKTISLEMTNKKIRGDVQVFKIDADTKRPLAGAKFELYNGEKKIGDYTTDENGQITVKNLEAGSYTWKEVEAPEHYNIDSKSNYDFNIYQDGQKEKIEVNDHVKTGDVEFTKTDVSTGKNIDGAKIEITGLDAQNKHIKLDFTSSVDGNKFTLPEGKYQFKEVTAPNGYKVNTEVGTFEINEGKATKANLKDERKQGTLEFTKTDVSTGKNIEGAKVKITCTEGLSKGKVVEFTSSKEGNKFILDEGKYTFEETTAPEGYKVSTEVGTFEIKDGEVTKANLKDARKQGTLEFTKTDVSTGKNIDGAKIKITCTEGLSKDKVVEFTSSKEGNKFTLDEGKYTFEETTAPTGYKVNKEVGTFEIKDGKITKANLKDERKVGTLDFTKSDVSTGKAIDGAKVKITCTEGLDKGKVVEFTSSKNGNKFTLAEGKYTFEETTAPTGYNLNTEKGNFEIQDGKVTKANLKDTRTTGKLIFKKTDVSTGEVLDGAKIKIVCTEGLDKGKVIEFISKKEGNEFTLLAGKYTFSETAAPQGYEKTTETGTFEITKQGDVIKCNLKNKKFVIEKTGAGFDVNNLIPIGVAVIFIGASAVFVLRRKKRA